MSMLKSVFLVFIIIATLKPAFSQSERFKPVVNNLALYKQKKDLKFLGNAKKSIDSLFKTHADSIDLENNIYKGIVYSTIVYIDSLNKLNQPVDFFDQNVKSVDKLLANKKIDRYEHEINFCKRCLANVYMRKGFGYVQRSDFSNAVRQFDQAQKYAPSFAQLNAFIAYSNSKLGNFQQALKFYNTLLSSDSAKVAYIQTAANMYKTLGDTAKALVILQNGLKRYPGDRYLTFDEAAIYNSKHDYNALEPLLPLILAIGTDNTEIVFLAANCYDHLGQFDKAESLYLHAIELNDVLYDPVYSLGLLCLRKSLSLQGDAANAAMYKAEQWLKKANEIMPNNSKCLNVLKLAYIKTGNQTQINRINNQLKQLSNP
jgi:tetratricopeptide (TPR) repeat protein